MKPNNIVCIGASAGGLEALELFFINMPPNSDLAFVVIQHLSSDYKSLMPELLSKKTNMTVVQVKKETLVERNKVYLIPPGNNMKINDGKLYLIPKDSGTLLNLPIDLFMKSLAMDQEEKSIGIILSGTGSDGMQGIRSIKEAGGMAMVQDKTTAKFDGMPKSAMSTGLIDFVLAPEDMPEQLISYLKHPFVSKQKVADVLLTDEDNLTKIFTILNKKKNIDFTYYKRSTLMRRIQRRLSVNHIKELSEYVDLLQRSKKEVNILQREFLIGVTNFFRDKEVFYHVRKKYIEPLVKRKQNGEIRAWIAGCSSGEEAYSFALLFLETIEKLNVNISLKIFATDIDENAIVRAGQGIYPQSIVADIEPEFLSKYFKKQNDNFQIKRRVRERVIFAQHNLINDPPFTNIDLISCRNLLIYLQARLQQKVLDLFSFSLNKSGILMLGKSESVGKMSDHFQQLSNKYKVYRFMGKGKVNILGKIDKDFKGHRAPTKIYSSTGNQGVRNFEESRILDRYLQTLYGEFLPPSIIVNEDNEILHTIGDTSGFLNIPPGKLMNDITKMAHKDIAIPIATGLQKLFTQNTDIKYSNVRIHNDDKSQKINLLLKPILQKRGQQNLAALFFETVSEASQDKEKGTRKQNYNIDHEAKQRITDLEQELQFNRENLQATIEELETSNEELQATNEELLSSNEELQSTNEELQSVNEELYTVNAEYQEKITELTELNNDMENLIDSIEIATLFIDENLDIRKMTSQVKEIYEIKENAVGNNISKYSHNIKNLNILKLIKTVMQNHKTFEKSVETEDNKYYMMKIKPYSIVPGVYSGVLVTFMDITHLNRINQELDKNIKWYNNAGEAAKIGGWEIDPKTGKTYWTDEVYKIHDVSRQYDHNVETGVQFYHPEDRKKLEAAVKKCLQDGTPYDLKCRFISAKGKNKIVRSIGKAEYDDNKIIRVYGSIQDITDQEMNIKKMQVNRKRYQELFNAVKSGVIVYQYDPESDQFILNDMNRTAEEICHFKLTDFKGKKVQEVFPNVADINFVTTLEKVNETGENMSIENKTYQDDKVDQTFDYEIYKLPNNEICTVFNLSKEE